MKKTSAPMLKWAMTAAFFSLLHLYAGAQNLESTLATYADKYTQERAYLHYDKSVYAAGETVWFKAYLMDDILPAQGSKTLYVDWVDDRGSVLAHIVSPIVEAVASGQFDIPATYGGNFIHVRAYTKWMLNFDTAFLYNKDIRVVSSKPQNSTSKTVAATPDIQFFPEGGDAVTGIKNRIAFLAADQWGRPVSVTGVVQNNAGATVATFASKHEGMGVFYIEPQPGTNYTAKWKDAKGATHTTPLPAAKSSGLTLQLELQNTKRRFTLTRTNDAPEPLKQLHMIGTMNENLVFQTGVNLATTTSFSGLIPTGALPTGILTVTVFDAGWNAVAERITFVKNNDYQFAPELTVERWGLNKRARDEIKITVPDSLQEANLSVAITDNALPTDSTDNIVSHLLLTSDVKGYVSNAAYYFKDNSDSTNENLDLVMLTHGWRRFKWDDIVKGKLPNITYPKDTSYLALSGKLYGVQPGSAPSAIVLFLKSKDSSSKMLMEPLDRNGSFNDPEAIFFDTLQVYYQVQPAKLFKNVDVNFMQSRLTPPKYDQAAPYFFGHAFINDTTGNYRMQLLAQERARVDELMKEKMLANVTVRANTKSPKQVLDEKYASGLFSGDFNSYQFDLVNDPTVASYTDIFSYLQGKVAGLQISIGGGPGGQASLQWRGGTPAVFLDQMNTTTDMLSSVPVSDIAYIKVFPPPFVGAPGGGSGGAIAIYTRRGNDVAMKPGKGLNRNTINGYTPVREFYSPNYDRIDPRNEERDLRTTLYWNPSVFTSPKKNVITLVFYNNDVTKSFRVIMEGITKDGRLAHVEQVME